ncbi:MAG: single-stranded DNA-binding protein [Cyanobacteria bacterium P01_A01_bin.3]
MNSIVLMAEIVTEPEMRFTPDNLAVASMLISFPSSRQGEPDYQVRVATFGETAQQVADTYAIGDRVTVEGQLHINTVERDGRNEKLAELSARRIYKLGASGSVEVTGTAEHSPAPKRTAKPAAKSTVAAKPATTPPPDMDDIPF